MSGAPLPMTAPALGAGERGPRAAKRSRRRRSFQERVAEFKLENHRTQATPENDFTVAQVAEKMQLSENKVIELFTGHGLYNVAAPGKKRRLRIPESAYSRLRASLQVREPGPEIGSESPLQVPRTTRNELVIRFFRSGD